MPAQIVAVTDRMDLFRFSRTHPEFNLSIVALADLTKTRKPGRNVLLIDIDLSDARKIMTLKGGVGRLPAGRRLALVDPGVYSQEIQAKGLGADYILPRPLSAQGLAALGIKPPAPQVPSPAPKPGPATSSQPACPEERPESASIQAGASLLVALFSQWKAGEPIDMQAVSQVGDQVVEAVSGVGLDQWLTTVRAHHVGTFQHGLLVTGVMASFGRFLGFCAADLRLAVAAALLHDIGKAGIPLGILNKPGRLTSDEFDVMKQHAALGHERLEPQPQVPVVVADAVRHHHEYLDGSGYPDGLAGKEINDLTRMLTVVDIYSALIEKRAYKKPRPPSEAMTILEELATTGKVDKVLVTALGLMVLT